MEVELYLCDLLNANVDLIPRDEIRRELRESILAEAVEI
jgi:predicted nucleotidyltransferase